MEKTKYILFGAGAMGRNALHFFGKENVRCFCDNARHASGECVEGVPIISADKLKELCTEDVPVVITTVKPKNIFAIQNQLSELGIRSALFEEVAAAILDKDKAAYSSQNRRPSFDYRDDREYLITWDRCDSAGTVSSYFWQDLWAARRISGNRVRVHYDIGSRLDGFIAHLLSFGQQVCMIDIRPLDYSIPGLDFVEADATNLDSLEDNSIESLSALCSLEHFGLGRYGDPIDPEACFKCFAAIQKKMKPGGNFYMSVPIGEECLCFNAHRTFYVETILKEFAAMELLEFSTCFQNEYKEGVKDIHRFDNWYDHEGDRMGLFWFRKK